MDTDATLVIVPAYDEQDSVGDVVHRVRALGLPCLVVDDGSADATADKANAAGATVVRMPVNTGVGGALRAGFRYAVEHGYRRAVQVDADLQHPPEAVPELLAALDGGAQLAIGSRFADGYEVGKARRWAMRFLAFVVRLRTGVALDDVTSGFRAVSEPLLSVFAYRFPAEYLGDTVEAILMAHATGATIAQVPVAMAPRRHGEATPSLRAGGHLARLVVALIAGKPSEMAR